MKAFRATYRPRKYDDAGDFVGFDESKVERVLVVAIPSGGVSDPWVVFINERNYLCCAPLDCFTECEWKE